MNPSFDSQADPISEGEARLRAEIQRLEAQLRDSTALLQSFYDTVPTCMGVVELLEDDLEVVHANRASCAFLKVQPEQARGSRFRERGMPEPILLQWLANARRATACGEPVRFEYFSDFSQRWFNATISRTTSGESARPRLVFTAEDVTCYKKTLEEKDEAEERFRRLHGSNIIGIVSGDDEYLLDTNDVFLQLLGYTRADLAETRLRWYDITAPEYRALGPQTVADVKASGAYGPFEKEYLRKDGSRVSVLIGCIRMQDTPYRDLSFVLDLTERKRLERRVLDAQKLESIALLAGGIAHDFNNLLVGVIGHASLAQEMVPPPHPVHDLLSQVIRNGERAAHLTRQMLAYSGQGRFVLEPLDLSAVFEEMSILVRPAVRKDIQLEMNLLPGLPSIEGDRGQMRQVFTNLVMNAAEAIEHPDGHIGVKTGVREFSAAEARSTDWAVGEIQPGRYVYLEVTDNGCGLDCSTRMKIFDPFFTTKFVGRGLGLAAVAGIVRGHKGAVSVTSEPGKGSRFLVVFPISATASTQAAVPAKPHEMTGTVLVVDDEPVVRQMVRTTLERHGFSVVQAESGPKAVEAFERHPTEFSLIVLDLSMPGMTGVQTLPELRRARPNVPVLIISGFSEAQMLGMFAGQSVSGFLQKPFTSQVLMAKIRQAIGQGLAPAP